MISSGDGVRENIPLRGSICGVRIPTAKGHSLSALWRCQLMTRHPTKLYSFHVANLRELELAMSNTARLARAAIASKDPQRALRSLLRLYSLLIGAWAECRLKKLLHEEFGFSDVERLEIDQEQTHLGQWQATVDSAFRKHHGLKRAKLDERTLGVAHEARRVALHNVLTSELRIVIEIRNKLAHGQWIYPFNNACTAVEPDKYKLINKENLQSLQFKYDLVRHLADAVHDLVVSPRTFERDFEMHFRKLLQVKTNLTKKSYAKYEQALIQSRQRARAQMVLSVTPP
jgi:hypothetical protein